MIFAPDVLRAPRSWLLNPRNFWPTKIYPDLFVLFLETSSNCYNAPTGECWARGEPRRYKGLVFRWPDAGRRAQSNVRLDRSCGQEVSTL